MKIATWNVNSVKARLEAVAAWLKEAVHDVVCLQEIKCTDDAFPATAFEDLGYNCAVHGQKTYNGVAILSKRPLEDVTPRLPGGDGDDHARYLEALVPGGKGVLRVASIYALAFEEPAALMGDYNVIPTPEDCHDPAAWANDALFQPESRAALRKIENLGYSDAFRACNAKAYQYTFWDYQAGAWQKDHGIRIDHILLSPQALDRLKACAIDKKVRGREKPSDHVPVWCEIAV
jgi:exodeoxyribonuclease-3